jgi:hypothetical protein
VCFVPVDAEDRYSDHVQRTRPHMRPARQRVESAWRLPQMLRVLLTKIAAARSGL